MRTQGKITHWNEYKAYGFITPSSGAKQVFVHIRAFTFLVYAKDKRAARAYRWRTKESTLHTLALIGGWPGALIAQQVLRHKSRKNAFQFVFWATVIVNCGFFGWLFTREGAGFMRMVIGEVYRNWPF